jgi:8-oxo-dGTP diphosphatase
MVYQIAAAVVRRDDTVLLVCQQGPNDPVPFWALPGGQVESGELLNEALAREVLEETGLAVQGITGLLYVAQTITASAEIVAHVFAATVDPGAIACADPDSLVSEAAFVPVEEAIERLHGIPWRPMAEPAIAHLRGETPPGTVWCYRHEAGAEVLIARL